ncbi:MAG: hypothetical protein WHU94_11975, partial [Thermogemmata sp.]
MAAHKPFLATALLLLMSSVAWSQDRHTLMLYLRAKMMFQMEYNRAKSQFNKGVQSVLQNPH